MISLGTKRIARVQISSSICIVHTDVIVSLSLWCVSDSDDTGNHSPQFLRLPEDSHLRVPALSSSPLLLFLLSVLLAMAPGTG